MSQTVHISVLLNEVIDSLRAREGGRFLDCTLGGGGHTKAILDANPKNTVTAIDRDLRAIKRTSEALSQYSSRLTIHHGSFSTLKSLDLGDSFDGVLADLGVSTDQIKEGRGFSFNDEASLDMRMNEEEGETAHEIVNTLSEQDLFKILAEGGVGPKARDIARAIVRARPIANAKELSRVINQIPQGKKTVNPATVAFQAIRMAVNRELSEIESLMEVAPRLVRSQGRLSVITFHSLEDKAVTKVMRAWEGSEDFPALWPGRKESKRIGTVVFRKAVVASDEECEANPSARSARLRVFEFH